MLHNKKILPVLHKWTAFFHKSVPAALAAPLKAPLMILVLSASVLTPAFTVYAEPTAEERLEAQRAMPVESNEIPGWPAGPVVGAQSAILMEADTGTILYSKNIHQQEFPASTTKILTCLIASERSTMDETVKISQTAVSDTPRDSSHIAMDAGEEITMEQALNGILIASANEVAFAVAEHVSGAWQDFAELMNQRARELGCLNSHFVNPNGLPDDNHYTTAYDLAMIARAFFANELLCKISSSTVLRIPVTEKQPDPIVEHSKNQLLKGRQYEYPYLVGSKTGYTAAARSCLVSCAEKDGMKLICVVMRDESPYQFEDTVSLFDYGFSNFEKVNVSQTETKYNIDNAGFFYSDNDIFGSSKPLLTLNREDSIILPRTASFGETVSTISYNTQNPEQAALIYYTYHDVPVGTASVDFVAEENETYSFDLPSRPREHPEQEGEEQEPVVINVVKVSLIASVIAAAIGLLVFLRWFIKNHQFSRPNTRRSWRRSRKKRRTGYQTVSEDLRQRRREQIHRARQKSRRTRRRGRF